MKRIPSIIFLVGLILLASPLDAQLRYVPVEGELVAIDPTVNRLRAQGVLQDGSWGQQLILGAANTGGRFGSYFTTDLYLANGEPDGSVVVNVAALTPTGLHPTTYRVTLPSYTYTRVTDVLARMGFTGGAALLLTPDTGTTSARRVFNAWAYTSTPGPNGGSYGVNLLAAANSWLGTVPNALNFSKAVCVGAAQDSGHRTNIGIANATGVSAAIRVSVYTGATGLVGERLVTVPPFSTLQFPLSDLTALGFSNAEVVFEVVSSGVRVSAYIVVNDNITNDANFQLASSFAPLVAP